MLDLSSKPLKQGLLRFASYGCYIRSCIYVLPLICIYGGSPDCKIFKLGSSCYSREIFRTLHDGRLHRAVHMYARAHTHIHMPIWWALNSSKWQCQEKKQRERVRMGQNRNWNGEYGRYTERQDGRYSGRVPSKKRKAKVTILKSILSLTGSQWSFLKSGVTCYLCLLLWKTTGCMILNFFKLGHLIRSMSMSKELQ